LSRAGDTGYTAGTYRSVSDGITETGKYVAVWIKTENDAWAVAEELFHADSVETPDAPRVFLPASQMAWIEAPYDLPPGAKAAVLSGDLSRPGPFVIRLQLYPGYRIPPHWYQGDITLTVISGILGVGLGETWDNTLLQPLMTGGFLSFPAGTRHFLITEAPTLVQLQGTGPLAISYAK
jgi:quercetin dioxygenase-like cupin family protein